MWHIRYPLLICAKPQTVRLSGGCDYSSGNLLAILVAANPKICHKDLIGNTPAGCRIAGDEHADEKVLAVRRSPARILMTTVW